MHLVSYVAIWTADSKDWDMPLCPSGPETKALLKAVWMLILSLALSLPVPCPLKL